jgi:hypothetical protein
MGKRAWLLGGLLAPVTHLVVLVLGGLIRPGYSHYSEAISELVASGAPNKALLDPLFVIYNLAGLAFSFGVLGCVRSRPTEKSRPGLIAAGFLVLGGLVGLGNRALSAGPRGTSRHGDRSGPHRARWLKLHAPDAVDPVLRPLAPRDAGESDGSPLVCQPHRGVRLRRASGRIRCHGVRSIRTP